MRKISIHKVLPVLLLLVVGASSVFLTNQISNRELTPEDAAAIFGGQSENGYLSAGYIVGMQPSGPPTICTMVMLDQNTVLTAAHCVTNQPELYLGTHEFRLSREENFPVAQLSVKPGWDGKDSRHDLAVVKLGANQPIIFDYAQIAPPQPGCNYLAVGYGRTENQYESAVRKSANVCIETIGSEIIRIKGSNGGVCFGDSGAPVFERGTNRLVGIISGIEASSANPNGPCDIGNQAIAVRVDVQRSFISSPLAAINGLRCGQECQNSSECGQDLICTINGRCQLGENVCLAGSGDYCEPALNINCPPGNECLLNRCRDTSLASTDFLSSSLEWFRRTANDNPPLLLLIGSFVILLPLLVLGNNKRPRRRASVVAQGYPSL